MNKFKEASGSILDSAMQFIIESDVFWNRSPTSVKLVIQLLLLPNGVSYDFETGFGTHEKLKSHPVNIKSHPEG